VNLEEMMHKLLICLACTLACCLGSPAQAQVAEPSVKLLDYYAFDPTGGRQLRRESFNWPEQRRISALVRFETLGYDKRKTASVFLTLKDRQGQDLFRDSKELTVHAGEHEYLFPLDFDIRNMYIEDRFKLDVEVKLTGGNKVSSQIEIVVKGPPMPDVAITGLTLSDPDTGKPLEEVKPGQRVRVAGKVSISGNATDILPVLMVWGRMSNEELKIDPWDQAPFSDIYRDSTSLASPNGNWSFGLNATMPTHFLAGIAESQPYEFKIVVFFTKQAVRSTEISGTVTASGSGALLSKDLDDRLLSLERNWHWTIQPLSP
jgi:hypothetical protein